MASVNISFNDASGTKGQAREGLDSSLGTLDLKRVDFGED